MSCKVQEGFIIEEFSKLVEEQGWYLWKIEWDEVKGYLKLVVKLPCGAPRYLALNPAHCTARDALCYLEAHIRMRIDGEL